MAFCGKELLIQRKQACLVWVRARIMGWIRLGVGNTSVPWSRLGIKGAECDLIRRRITLDYYKLYQLPQKAASCLFHGYVFTKYTLVCPSHY